MHGTDKYRKPKKREIRKSIQDDISVFPGNLQDSRLQSKKHEVKLLPTAGMVPSHRYVLPCIQP